MRRRHSLQTTAENVSSTTADGVRLHQALSVWPRIAMLSFGSPAVQLAAMYRILVEEKRWMSRDRFLNALNYCLALPGPEAQLLAAYVGWMMHGMLGALLAGGLVILPGMICMMALSYGYVTGADSTVGDVLLYGLKPAILVIVLDATIRVGRQVLRTRLMLALAGLAFIGTFSLTYLSCLWLLAQHLSASLPDSPIFLEFQGKPNLLPSRDALPMVHPNAICRMRSP